MSRFFGVIVLAFVFVFLAVPVSLQAQHRGGFHGGPTATFNARPPVAQPGPAFLGRPVAPFVNSPVTPFTGGIVTPFVGRPVTPPVITIGGGIVLDAFPQRRSAKDALRTHDFLAKLEAADPSEACP